MAEQDPKSPAPAPAPVPHAAESAPDAPAAAIEAAPAEQAAGPETEPARGLPLPRMAADIEPGTTPGIELHELEQMPSTPGEVYISCIDYSPEQHHAEEVDDIESFMIYHRPPWSAVRWINVDGLTDTSVIHALAEKYELHPLAIEDLLHIPQRPKVDTYGDDKHQKRMFIIVRMIELVKEHLKSEQISIFLGHTTVLTFQETRGDVWGPIRQRLATAGSRLRNSDASFLVYSLIDAIVDHCFPILEHYGDRLEDIEDLVLASPTRQTINEIHKLKRELLLLRRAIWPMREVVHSLQREPHECFSETSRTYMRDVYDHVVQIIDIVETYREVGTGVTETYMSSMSNRLNEVMKVLTIITTIFVPLTFLAGVYGMNFEHMPEIPLEYSYGVFWAICITLAGTMIYLFRRRGWL